MTLNFPPLAGGVTQGLNHAGIETFEGDYAHYVIRECVQNSLDASASLVDPVQVKVSLLYVPTAELPFMEDLKATLYRCRVFWKGHPKPRGFFEAAIKYARQPDQFVLRISDYGTTGVPGGDDDIDSPWFGLVRSRGVSIQRDQGSGGAFGIGKDAPLAASPFRTVIYSTRTLQGHVAMQGICRLATHKDAKALTQGTGFIGRFDAPNAAFKALRDPQLIPPRFLRAEPGLDVAVVGFRDELHNWENPFVAAAISNFWPAIHFAKLAMTIGKIVIDHKTLPRLMTDFRMYDPVEDTIPFFDSLTAKDSRHLEKKLSYAGHCRIHVHLGRTDLPRKIIMTRKTGMVIYPFAPKVIRVPFAGLFQCDDPDGNRLLRALEPPRHDNWEAKRASRDEEKKALAEIKQWIRSALKELIPDINSQLVNEDSIADLLPDEDVPGPPDSTRGESDLGGVPLRPDRQENNPPEFPSVRIPGTGGRARDGGGPGGGKEGNVTDPKKGDSKRTGGRMNQSGTDGDQGGGAQQPRPVRIALRSFQEDSRNGTYHIVARSMDAHEGAILFDAITEEGSPVPCQLAAAWDETGKPLTVEGNRITGLAFQPAQPMRLKIQLQQPARVALRASTL